jgi:putative NIF3 family GTP cyclohydrolase 1 type 2
MEYLKLTRRRFAGLAAAATAAHAMDLHGQEPKGSAKLTAGDLAARISSNSGVSLPERTVDGFKAGDESTPVRGVAVTAMATMDVLHQAAMSGLNLVVSFEPTFYGRSDAQPSAAPQQGPAGRAIAQDDPILAAKRNFLQANGMAVYRLHDQWAGRKENEHAIALAKAMGWTRPASGMDLATEYEITSSRLSAIVPLVRTRLKSSGGLRVVGDPNTQVRRVTVLPGLQTIAQLLARLPSTDLILTGETRDWEGPEYVGDASTAGLNKGLITVGKVVSADPGMHACADWMKTFVNEVPVQWIAAGEPFWRPA